MTRPPFSRVAFCMAAAAAAVGIADPLVESLSDRGAFGPGVFTDRSTAHVVPLLCCALISAALVAAVLARRLLVRHRSTWRRTCESALAETRAPSTLLTTFALQIPLLFGIETLEQVVVVGRPLGGTIWLGGPVLVSLAIHALAACASVWLLRRALRSLAIVFAEAIELVRRIVFALTACDGAPVRTRIRPASWNDPALARRSGRAPPTLRFR